MRHDIQEYPRSAISLNCTTGLRSFHLEVACHSPAHIAAILSKLPGCLSEPRQTIDFNLIQTDLILRETGAMGYHWFILVHKFTKSLVGHIPLMVKTAELSLCGLRWIKIHVAR